MIRHSLILLAGLLLIPSGLGVADDKNDNDKLQGEWALVSMESRGMSIPEEKRKDWRLIVKGDEWLHTSQSDSSKVLKMTFKVDPAKSPKEIDFMPMGPTVKAGAVLKGIYKLDGDNLAVCQGIVVRDEGDEERPTEFKAGDLTMLAVFMRVAKK